MIQVLPAIIPHSKDRLLEEFEKVAHFAPLVQVDISDGVFTKVTTWPYNGRDTDFFESLHTEADGWPEWEQVDVELHLMIQNPEQELDKWLRTGPTSVVFHIEATEHVEECIEKIKTAGVGVGIAIKPRTPLEVLYPFVDTIDYIQCMGSNDLGKHGVELESSVLSRITELHSRFPNSIISIDIGVREENARELLEAGVSKLVVGSALLDASDPQEVYDFLCSLDSN